MLFSVPYMVFVMYHILQALATFYVLKFKKIKQNYPIYHIPSVVLDGRPINSLSSSSHRSKWLSLSTLRVFVCVCVIQRFQDAQSRDRGGVKRRGKTKKISGYPAKLDKEKNWMVTFDQIILVVFQTGGLVDHYCETS